MWFFETNKAVFSIVARNERYHVFCDDEDLGNYATPEQAADEAGGHIFFFSSGIAPEALCIPRDLAEWQRKGA